MDIGSGPAWTTDGRLFAELATGRDLPTFVGVDAGGATSTAAAGFYTGIGPRRTDPAGRLLRCGITGDWGCDGTLTDLRAVGPTGAPTVWSENDEAIAVPDWAWATDGGLWLLVESTRPGPREVVLRRVMPDGRESVVATFQGIADDLDPNSYQPTAAFAGFAPDDSRVLITLNGDEHTPTAMWSIDTRTGRASRLGDGVIAGWLDPATLEQPRETVERIPETPEVIRGQWSDGYTSIRIGQSGLTLRTGTWTRPTVQVRATGSDTIAIDGLSFIPGCDPDSAGYRWSAAGKTLTLTPFDEPCSERAAILGRTFERAIAFTESSRPTVEPGTRYLVTDLPAPFRVTIPAGKAVDVDQRSGSSIQFGTRDGDASVTIFVPSGSGTDDPCYRGSGDTAIDLRRGFDAIVEYLERSEIIGASETDPLTFGQQSVRSLIVRPNASSACESIRLFGIESPISLDLPTRLAVVEAPGGARLVVAVRVSTAARPVPQPWVDQLLASIEWLP
jgi:hypothetical protein